jgi:hypothetical protein
MRSPNEYRFDQSALIGSRLILSEYIARNAVMLNQSKTLIERHVTLLLNTLFLFSVFMMIVLFILYWTVTSKQRKLARAERERDELRDQVRLDKKLCSLIATKAEGVYWIWDESEGNLILSEELKRWIGIRIERFDHLNDLLILLNMDQEEELREKIEEAIQSATPQSLSHTLIGADFKTKQLLHTIYPVLEASHRLLVGILVVEDD